MSEAESAARRRLERFVLAARLASVGGLCLAGAACVHAWPHGWLRATPAIVLALASIAQLARVPRRRSLVELAVLELIAGAVAFAGAPPFVIFFMSAAPLFVLAWNAPESGLLRLNALDRYFVVHDWAGFRPLSHHMIDTREPWDRAALEGAIDDVMREVPIARSFVREALLGAERFVAREPWVAASALLDWSEDADPAREAAAIDRPLDIRRAPPFRLRHAPRSEGGFRLVVTLHHSAADGVGGFLFLDRLLRRYDERRAGRAPEPFPPAPAAQPRFRELFRARGLAWTWRMIRRHVRPMDKVGVQNATLVDDEAAIPEGTRYVLVTIAADRWERLKERASELGRTRNDLLVAATLRAADAWRRTRGREDRAFRVLLPQDLRPVLGLEPCFQNYSGIVDALFRPEDVRSADLPELVSERVQLGKTVEEAIETPVNLGVLAALLPPGIFRNELVKWDEDPRSFFYSIVMSNVRVPALPLPASVERVWGRSSMPRQPGVGVVVMADARQVTLTVQYVVPAASESGARDFAERLEEELARLVGA